MADIRDVIAAMEPKVAEAFISAIRDIRSEARLATIAAALEEGRIEDALRALHLEDEFFAPLDDALRAAYIQGGRDAMMRLPAITDPFPVPGWSSALTRALRRLRQTSGPSSGS